MTQDLHTLLDPIVAISRQAGEAILTIYEGDIAVEQKADESPLTQADLASHRCICAALQALTPNIPLLSEESASIPFSERSQWTRYWLIDPLDGTKEFIKRNGEFTVNIALIDNHQAVLGVVHVPVTNTTYFGGQGLGAFKQVADQAPQAIQVQQPAAQPLRVVGSRSHANPALQAVLDKAGEHEMIPMGSSLKFCLVAEGSADFYPRLGPTSEWDTAAAQAVVEAAGGQVTMLNGETLSYNRKDSYLNTEFMVFGDPSRDWPALF